MSTETALETPYYFLSVKTKNVTSTVLLNDAPIISVQEGDDLVTAEPVNTWLMPGNNRLSLSLSSAEDNLINASAEITLFLHDPSSETPKALKTIAQISYPEKESNASKPILPSTKTVEFESPYQTPANLWKDATITRTLTIDDKTTIVNLINQFQHLLANNKVEDAVNLLSYKITDDALCENKPFDKIKEAAHENHEWLAQQPGLTFKPVSIQNLSFTLCCNNKLVNVARHDHTNAIQFESDKLYFDIPVYVALINKKWQIVR